MMRMTTAATAIALALTPLAAKAQTTDATATEAAAATDDALLTAEELQTLVAPIALYPDTLLIQVLVAATFPLEVVKADRFLSDNPDTAPADLKPQVDEQGWDESVAVLATAFPDVLTDMAVHVDWTEAMGTAMLAQSDDVMDAVQFMRADATETGALADSEQQTVEVTQEDGDQTIIIQPADPQVVYVPQYSPQTVYSDPATTTTTSSGISTGDAIATGLITFTTFALISEIFDDDDDWYRYWGCRNCGGWGGGQIIRSPDIDIDIDGDVNIGNRGDIGWKPDDRRRDDARDKISNHRDGNRKGDLALKKPDRGSELRDNLSARTGTRDISRPDVSRQELDRTRAQTAAAKVQRPKSPTPEARKAAVDRTKARPAAQQRPARTNAKAPSRPKAKNVAKSRPKATRKAASRSHGGAMTKRAGGNKARAGAKRGRASHGKRR